MRHQRRAVPFRLAHTFGLAFDLAAQTLFHYCTFGLARYRIADQAWQYLALPGAVLYFKDNELAIATRHYFRGNDYQQISALLTEQLLAEEEALHGMKDSLHRMEEEILKRLWQLGREQALQ